MEDYFAAKRRLFEMLPADAPAVINVDDPRGAVARGDRRDARSPTASTRPPTCRPGRCRSRSPDSTSTFARRSGMVHVRSKLVGRPNVYNILARRRRPRSSSACRSRRSSDGLQRLPGVPGRFEVVSSAADDITVVVDYAHTDDALRNLLETARPMAARRLITVFGAGGDRDRTKRPLMGMVAARLSDVVVITSDNPRSEDPARIIEEVKRGADAGDASEQRRACVTDGRSSRGDSAGGARRRRGRRRADRRQGPREVPGDRRTDAARSTTSRWRGRRWRRGG